jgi:hypothetical protein
MIILIVQILYGAVFLMMLLMGLFVTYHILAYSFTHTSRIVTLAIFLPVAAVLLISNLILFFSIDLGSIFSDFM